MVLAFAAQGQESAVLSSPDANAHARAWSPMRRSGRVFAPVRNDGSLSFGLDEAAALLLGAGFCGPRSRAPGRPRRGDALDAPERDALRRFRLSRVRGAQLTAQTFAIPADFEFGPPEPPTDSPVIARVAFDGADLAAIEERLSGFGATLQAKGSAGPRRCARTRSRHGGVGSQLGARVAAELLSNAPA